MIGRLTGKIDEKNPDGSCLIDVGGVGYEVFVPAGALGRLPPTSSELTLYVHSHVREDAFTLYGFDSAENRAAFRLLLSVSSVGPRIAMAILGTMDASELAAAIAKGDRARFKGIAGVGNKTVDRLLLELRDKMGSLVNGKSFSPQHKSVSAPQENPLQSLADALIQLGYKRAEAMRAVSAVAPEADGKEMEILLREALAALA